MPEANAYEGNYLNRKQFLPRGTFDERVGQVPESVVLTFMKDAGLVLAIKNAGYPTDQIRCDALGEQRGLGAEEIAAISEHVLKQMDKPRGPLH